MGLRILHEAANRVIEKARGGNSFASYRFPSNLGGFGIQLNFYQYSYSKAAAYGKGDFAMGAIKKQVVLPLPISLIDNYGIQVQGSDLGVIGGLAADKITSAGQKGLVGAAEQFSNQVYEAGKDSFGKAKSMFANESNMAATALGAGQEAIKASQYFLRNTIESLFQGAGTALSVTNGTAINPHTALAFEGVSLKNYSFNWRLSPKNVSEAETIRNIINVIKSQSHPSFESVGGSSSGSLSRGLLKYPDLVTPMLIGLDPSHFWIFKPCMISSISVNYAPEGVAVQAGGKPAIIELTVEMTETVIRTRDDFNDTVDV